MTMLLLQETASIARSAVARSSRAPWAGTASRIAAAVLALGLLTTPLRAQAPAADARASARALAEKGYALYDAHRYEEAIAVLQQAEGTYHAPTLLFAMAKSHAALGRLVEACDLFLRVVAEPLPDAASPAFHEAQRSARGELAAIEKRIPTLRIIVLGAAGRAVRVTLDDAEVPPGRVDVEVPQNPGPHRVMATPVGGVGQSRMVDLREGAHVRLALDLGALDADAISGDAAVDPHRWSWLAPALVGFGVGAAGLAVGTAEGVIAANTSATLEGRCPGGLCAATDAETLASGRRAALVSTVGFVAAVAGIGAGVALVIVRPGASPAKAALRLGPGSIGVEGAF